MAKVIRSKERPSVIVVGGGIAGLTAAHELVERGFDVHVVEREPERRVERDRPKRGQQPAIGGMARNQWAQVSRSNAEQVRGLADVATANGYDRPVYGTVFREEGQTTKKPTTSATGAIPDAVSLVVKSQEDEPTARQQFERQYPGVSIKDVFFRPHWFCRDSDKEALAFIVGPVSPSPSGGGPTARTVQAERAPITLPGEHGYRYFPSFYRHLFDTMRRIPAEDRTKSDLDESEIPLSRIRRTAFDNLETQEFFAFAFEDGEDPVVVSRAPVSSIAEAFRLQRVMQARLGFEMRDMLRMQVRLLTFMTSCRERREALGERSWIDWLRSSGGPYSPAFEDALDRWPQALIGLRGAQADAHTFGNVLVQQALDQLKGRPLVDATLNGSTNEALLDPWYRHLVDLGVTFHCGEARSLRLVGKSDEVPMVQPVFGEMGPVFAGDEQPVELPAKAYLVLAVPPREAYRLCRTLESSAESLPAGYARTLWAEEAAYGTIAAVRRVLEPDGEPYNPACLTHVSPGGNFRSFAGVQYFLINRDIPFLRGHLFLPESTWGLSAVSQSQLRIQRNATRLGAVSLVLGSLDRRRNGKNAFEHTREELASAVFEDLQRATAETQGPQEDPRFDFRGISKLFHIDEGLIYGPLPDLPWLKTAPPTTPGTTEFDEYFGRPWFVTPDRDRYDGASYPQGSVQFNNTPYLALRPGQFRRWPGRLNAERPSAGYEMVFRNLVFCGSYTRTFTRIVTMESSNEAARHAVNAIVLSERRAPLSGEAVSLIEKGRDGQKEKELRGDRCKVWTMESREPEDLEFWKEIDKRLFDEGLPPLLEILDIDAKVAASMPSSQAKGMHSEDILNQVLEMHSSAARGLAELSGWASPLLQRLFQELFSGGVSQD